MLYKLAQYRHPAMPYTLPDSYDRLNMTGDVKMASNEFLWPVQKRRDRLSELGSQLRNLQDKHQELERAIKNFKAYQPNVEREKLVRLDAKASELSLEIANLERNKAVLVMQLKDVRSKKASPVLFWKFFEEEQKQLRAEAARLKRKANAVVQRLENDNATLSETNSQAELTKKRLAAHDKFDLENTVRLLSGIPKSIDRTKADRAAASAELTLIETRIRPHVQEHERLQSEVSTLNSDIAGAEVFNRNLDAAPNGYERKKVHEQCESRFGTGRPVDVINDRRGKVRRLENNIPKLERRIREELEKSDRNIEHLLIDGNNVCYEGQTFIELRALIALLAALVDQFKITVVFDASIRSLLKASTQDIKRRLRPSITTHIAPTKTGADEYLLKLAGNIKSTFILSNDRYAEYYDFDAVKSGRVLRFLIADGKIMANDFDISVTI
jgi:chromosome segregation ATPase